MTERMPHLLALGLGYTARSVGRLCSRDGWTVSGTARSQQGIAAIVAQGWRGLHFSGTAPSSGVAGAMQECTHLLVSAAPEDSGDPVLRQHEVDVAAAPRLRSIVYLSSIGVYGDHQGRWIDETTPPAPISERSRWRLAAEQAWQRLGEKANCPVVTLRLPGIYGPGRSALDGVRNGTARRIVKPGQVFNRAHVDDIATVAFAAMSNPACPSVLNVTDDEPAPPQDVVTWAAKLLDAPLPPEIAYADAVLSPMAASFYGESKRVSNLRMKRELGVALAHPTFREGLAAILAAELPGASHSSVQRPEAF